MKYKQSEYNVMYKDNEKILLYNSLSKRYLKSITLRKEVLDILQEPDSYEDSDLFVKLKDAGMLVEAEVDQRKNLNYLQNEYIFSPQLHLCILPTEQCNLRCSYCYEDYKNGEMSAATQKALILWLKRNLKKYTSLHVEWFGGEPLVAKEVIFSMSKQMIELCRQARKPFTASIVTNGTLLDLEVFKKLLECHVTGYQVTIDGVKETHDKLKIHADGSGSYDKIMENLSAIKDNVHSMHFKFSIRTNVTKEVIEKMPEHLKQLEKLGCGDKRFTFYFRPVGQWTESKELAIEKSLVKEFSALYESVIGVKAKLDYSIYGNMLENQICFAARKNQFVIRSNGKVCKCTMLLDREENFIGDLQEDGTMIIDNEKLQRWIFTENCTMPECKECNMKPSCFGLNCPAKRNILRAKNYCGYEAETAPYILQLLDQSNCFEVIEE